MSLLSRLHPASVHFPIALLSLASVAGLLFLYWRRRPEFIVLTWWPLYLGWAGGAVAVLTGLLAQRGLPPAAPYRDILNWHISSGLALLVVYGSLIYWRWRFGTPKAQRARVRAGQLYSDLLDDPNARIGFTLLAILGLLLVVASGWNGGRLVYEWGVNVAR
ncbi:MAG: hypothetical protein DCC55_09185 [Chloroflexi bacterium]|nr:MAG: hypothetical protein DCC55_09185 [Chloroflexota bacterium]